LGRRLLPHSFSPRTGLARSGEIRCGCSRRPWPAIAALDNHHLLEFYLVPRSFEWLVAENEHNVLFVVGDKAVAEIARVRG